jgi:hypothetical protein
MLRGVPKQTILLHAGGMCLTTNHKKLPLLCGRKLQPLSTSFRVTKAFPGLPMIFSCEAWSLFVPNPIFRGSALCCEAALVHAFANTPFSPVYTMKYNNETGGGIFGEIRKLQRLEPCLGNELSGHRIKLQKG